jgi:hypothetical protein
MKESQFGKVGAARKDGAIIVYDYEGSVIKRYKLSNVWPKSLEIGSPKGENTWCGERDGPRYRGRPELAGTVGCCARSPGVVEVGDLVSGCW